MADRAPERMWLCEDCGWQWPLKDAPYTDAECDVCGGEMHPVKSREPLPSTATIPNRQTED